MKTISNLIKIALNALESGSAAVNGNTVTLTRGIHAQKDLTVPEDVTLVKKSDCHPCSLSKVLIGCYTLN